MKTYGHGEQTILSWTIHKQGFLSSVTVRKHGRQKTGQKRLREGDETTPLMRKDADNTLVRQTKRNRPTSLAGNDNRLVLQVEVIEGLCREIFIAMINFSSSVSFFLIVNCL